MYTPLNNDDIKFFENFLTPIKKRIVFSFKQQRPFIIHFDEEKKCYSFNNYFNTKIHSVENFKKNNVESLTEKLLINNYISINDDIHTIKKFCSNDLNSSTTDLLHNCFYDIGNIAKEKITLSGFLVSEIFRGYDNQNLTYLEIDVLDKYKDSSDIDIFISEQGYKNLFNFIREKILEEQSLVNEINSLKIESESELLSFDEDDWEKFLLQETVIDDTLSSHPFPNIKISDRFISNVRYKFFLNQKNESSKTFYLKNELNGIIYNIINTGEEPFDTSFKKNPFDFMHLEMCLDGEYIYGSKAQCLIQESKLLIPTEKTNKNLFSFFKRIIKYCGRGYHITDLVLNDLHKQFDYNCKKQENENIVEDETSVFDYDSNNEEEKFSLGKKHNETKFFKINIPEKDKDNKNHRYVLNYIPYLWIQKKQFKQKLDLL